jgi:hypothetical protein
VGALGGTVSRLLRLVVRRLLGGLLAAHLGGLLLLALVVAVEEADLPAAALLETWRVRLPGLWAQAAAVLDVAGASLAVFRMRRDGVLLALGSFGVAPTRALLVAAMLGLGVGFGAARLADPPGHHAGAEWTRGHGGWFHDGVAVPDEPDGTVDPVVPRARAVWSPAATGAAAATAGAALGLWAGGLATVVVAVLLLVGDALAQGLVARDALPPLVAWLPALLLTCGVLLATRAAPLFPRRWG